MADMTSTIKAIDNIVNNGSGYVDRISGVIYFGIDDELAAVFPERESLGLIDTEDGSCVEVVLDDIPEDSDDMDLNGKILTNIIEACYSGQVNELQGE